MTVRRRLSLLILGIVLPLIVFAGFLVVRDYDDEKTNAEQHLRGTVRALSLAVEKELESKLSALKALALSRSLADDSLADFRGRAEAFVALQPPGSRIILADEAGRVLIDTSRAGAASKPVAHAEVARQVHATGQPVISDLLVDSGTGAPEVAVSVPVLRAGRVVYDLTLGMPATLFLDLLQRQRLQSGWIGSVLDRRGVHVARTHLPDAFIGRKAAPRLVEQALGRDEGTVETNTIEGIPVIAVFSRASTGQWIVAISMPKSALQSQLMRSLALTASGGVLLLLGALLVALLMTRRIVGPLQALVGMAAGLGRGDPINPGKLGMAEADNVAAALAEASAERARAEAAVRASEERLRLAQEAGGVGLWDWDLRGGQVHWSEQVYDILGLDPSRDKASYELFRDRILPEDRSTAEQALEAALRREPTLDVEFRIRRADTGAVRWLASRGEVVKDAQGEPVRMLGVNFDVTERKEVIEKLRASEEQFRQLTEHVPDIVWYAAPDGAVGFLNARWYALTGLDERASLRFGWIAALHPDDRDRTVEAWQKARNAVSHYVVEMRFRRRDGVYRWHIARAEPLRDGNAAITGWFGTCTDIHDKKVAEDELRQLNEALEARVAERTRDLEEVNARLRQEKDLSERLIESSLNGIVAIDRSYRYTIFNPAMEEMTGLPRRDVLGRMIFEIFPFLAGTPAEASWRRAVERQEASVVREARFDVPGGRSGYYEASYAPLYGRGGECIGAVALVRETTEQRRMEQQLQQAQKMEAVGQLTGGIAHDFNNLLAAVTGNLELIEARTSDAAVRRLVASAARAAERGARLTAQLLAFSRRQHLAPKPVDLNLLVGDMGDLMTRTIGGLVRIERILAPDLWPVLVDPNQLELVILNLAINARDAMPLGGVLTIETANVPPGHPRQPRSMAPAPYVAVSVSDTGSGMAADVLAKAFEPFFTTKEQGKGTGLGLSMVYGIVQQSGGTVEIDSQPGRGTTVRVYLPRANDAVASGPSHDVESAETAPAAPELAGRTILLVDDDPDVRRLTADYLVEAGCRVIEAESGWRALECVNAEARIDLLLIDYAMPGMTGAEVAENVGATRPDLPVLFLTGYADSEAIAVASSEDRVVRKPFRLADLAAKIGIMLQRSAAHAGRVVSLQRKDGVQGKGPV